MTYYQMIRGVSKFDLRFQMVERLEKVGISQTAREYRTTGLTVRKWKERYRQEGLRGLEDRCRAPHSIPHKTPKEMEGRVIEGALSFELMCSRKPRFHNVDLASEKASDKRYSVEEEIEMTRRLSELGYL